MIQIEEFVLALILAFIGIIVGIIMTIIYLPIRDITKQNVLIKQELDDIDTDLNRIQRNTLLSAVSSHSYLSILTSEWEFWEKLFRHRKDKILISTEIVDKHIEDHDQVIIDSGTTVDQIPRLLNQKFKDIGKTIPLKIYTNNIIAAISVIPPQINVYLLNGDIDEIYGATYNRVNVPKPLEDIDPTKIVLAATLITYNEGPMVSTKDDKNIDFKNALINKAFTSKFNCVLIIATDWTKFIDSPPPNFTHKKVVDQTLWDKVKSNNNFLLCITEPPQSNKSAKATTARAVIQKFKDNEKNNGMKVIVCEW